MAEKEKRPIGVCGVHLHNNRRASTEEQPLAANTNTKRHIQDDGYAAAKGVDVENWLV